MIERKKNTNCKSKERMKEKWISKRMKRERKKEKEEYYKSKKNERESNKWMK